MTSVDVIVIDAEHGNFDRERLSRCVFAAKAGGVSVLVRLPDMDPKGVQHSINIGADGVMIPHVDSAEKLRALSTFAKTTAIERAFAGAGRASRQRTLAWPDFRRDLSERLLLIAQLDEPAGVNAATAVAAIDGVDGIFLGSIGFPSRWDRRDRVHRWTPSWKRYAMQPGRRESRSLFHSRSMMQPGNGRRKGSIFAVIDSDLAILRKGMSTESASFARRSPNRTDMSGIIFIHGLHLRARHGDPTHHRECGQRFVIDLNLTVDIEPAARSDRLSDTIDYAAIVATVTAAFTRSPPSALGRAAEAVAQAILDAHQGVPRPG